MPSKEHVQLLQRLNTFQLAPSEQRALDEFNALYKQALVADMTSLIRKHNPPKDVLRHYLRIKVEGEHYPEYQTARWQWQYPSCSARSGLFQAPSNTRLQALSLGLPPGIAKLTASSLIRLAFSAQGKYLYHYLTHCVNDTLRQRADRSHQPIKAFYDELNKMESAQRHALLQKKQGEWPAPYVRLAAVMDKHLALHENDLACTDGKPLDFIASVYVLKELKAQQKNTWAGNINAFKLHACPWTPEQYALLSFAAEHGSYTAAFTITRLFDQSLAHKSAAQALQDYNQFHQQWFSIFSQQYQAAGSLLFVNVQKVLAHRLEIGLPILTEEIYRTFVLAQQQEASHKNTLRLTLQCDDCQPLVEQLHAHVDSPTPITTIDEALDHLHLEFPQLTHEFNAIDCQSPIRREKRNLNPFAFNPSDR